MGGEMLKLQGVIGHEEMVARIRRSLEMLLASGPLRLKSHQRWWTG